MKNMTAIQSMNTRTTIEDLNPAGTELAEEDLQLASGGMRIIASYEAACCTINNDTDYHRVD